MTDEEIEEFTDAAHVISSVGRSRNGKVVDDPANQKVLLCLATFIQTLPKHDLDMLFTLLLVTCVKHDDVRHGIIESMFENALNYSRSNEIVRLIKLAKQYRYQNHLGPSEQDMKQIDKAMRKGYGRKKEPFTAQYLKYARDLQKQYYARGEEPDMKAIHKQVRAKYPKCPATLAGFKSQLSRTFGKSTRKKASE